MATTPITYPNLIIGNDSANTLSGAGKTGNVKISGLGGNDKITGVLTYNNYLEGGDGADTITGGNLADQIFGGAGIDILKGGGGVDTIKGGSENDTIDGGAGKDKLYGEAGNDTINGGTEGDDIDGGGENDTLNGQGGTDYIWGGSGNDTIDGGSEYDVMRGGSGADIFKGLTSADIVYMDVEGPINDTDVDMLVFSGGNNVGSYTLVNGILKQDQALQLNDFVSGTDKIDLRTVGGLNQSFIFDASYVNSDTQSTSQKSILIGAGLVAIDFKGDNGYDIVISVAGNVQLAQSDFMLV